MNKSNTILSILLIFSALTSFSQEKSPVLMSVDGRAVTKEEFENIYKKNNKEQSSTKPALDEYLELFTNFKCKVREAEALGMDTAKKFITELAGYRQQLARPYLVDNQLNDNLINEAYERMKKEINASHILIKLTPNPEPEDTLKAWKKIADIKKKIETGQNFDDLAKKYSEDPSAATNGGDLGYFTSMGMVYPFETMAYNTPVGKVSNIVRTKFGYHIIKVKDVRPARGETKVAHIMVKTSDKDDAQKMATDEKKINEIYAELTAGGDFSALATKYSDDKSSASKGGELPMFGTGKMVPEFENESFNLKSIGEISKPFKTAYGWHIVKKLDQKPLANFDDLKGDIKSKIAKDSRSELSKNSFVNKLKKEYKFTETKSNTKPLIALLDTNIYAGNWSADKASKMLKPVMEFDGKKYTQFDFAKYMETTQRKGKKGDGYESYINLKFDKFVEETIIGYEDSKLETKYPQFKSLMQEYRDGILLFDLTDQKVWSKSVKDSLGLDAYYAEHKNEFMWGKRIEADIYTCKDIATANTLKKMLKKGKQSTDIVNTINADSQLNISLESGIFEVEEKEFLKNRTMANGVSDNISFNEQILVVNTKRVIEPEPKKMEDAKGLITSAYQNYLEQEWIKSLRTKYKVEVNKDVLYSIK
jgi:peptidyl-prolyl cis-trans isomerase SurA